MHKYYVYILKSGRDQRFYIGSTSHLQERLLRHNSGGVTATKHRRPLEIVYTELFSTKQEALSRERYLKSLKSHKAIQDLIEKWHGSSGGRARD